MTATKLTTRQWFLVLLPVLTTIIGYCFFLYESNLYSNRMLENTALTVQILEQAGIAHDQADAVAHALLNSQQAAYSYTQSLCFMVLTFSGVFGVPLASAIVNMQHSHSKSDSDSGASGHN